MSYTKEVNRIRMFREWFEAHRAEVIVGIIGTAISMALAIGFTGDLQEALAGPRRR